MALDIEIKWGGAVAKRGFAQIPNYLLLVNQFLDDEHKLSPVESLVIIQLAASWWRKDENPFPSMGMLARRAGVSERQVQRAIAKLETSGFIKRAKRKTKGIIQANSYDMSGTVQILNEIAAKFPNLYERNISINPAASSE
jgi:DNA-binding transcriptional regulator YhcF (GntR family)